MTSSHSKAFVFSNHGRCTYIKIFPALQAMDKRGNLDIPIVGVAKAGWNLDRMSQMLRYVDGDYHDASTFEALRVELGSAERPSYYLPIPPALFRLVTQNLDCNNCSDVAS